MNPSTSHRSVIAPGLPRGQVILVTGSGTGTAYDLAGLGAYGVLVGRHSEKLSNAAPEIIDDGGQAIWRAQAAAHQPRASTFGVARM